MTKKLKSVADSVRERLLKLARARSDDFLLVLLRYANERFLYRLAQSAHATRFVLKGAALFTVWAGAPHRATRDLDLLVPDHRDFEWLIATWIFRARRVDGRRARSARGGH